MHAATQLDTSTPGPRLDLQRIRADFPTLARRVGDKALTYLDSGASALKPRCVLERLQRFYADDYSNIHRGAHALSAQATADYEGARAKVAQLLNAPTDQEVVFVRGTTEAANLVASSYGGLVVSAGDKVVISELEHHSNFLPWQRLCEARGAELAVIPIDDQGQLVMTAAEQLIDARTKIVAVAHVSNVLGTIVPVERLVELSHAVGAKVFVDGAQGVVHLPVNLQTLGCDFYAFSGHKLYGPTGIGALWARTELLAEMPPYQVGGGTIDRVAVDGSSYLDGPLRFEAGTPQVAGALGLATAIDYLLDLGMESVAAHERAVTDHAMRVLADVPGLKVLGTTEPRAGVFSFEIEAIHPADVGAILDQQGIAVRVGHHCAQPVMRRYGVPATTRASLGLYNTMADIDVLVAGLHKVIDLFA